MVLTSELVEQARREISSDIVDLYRELAELRKANALTQSAAQEAALSAEMSAKEELRDLLSQQQLQAQKDKETLVLQVNQTQHLIPLLFIHFRAFILLFFVC